VEAVVVEIRDLKKRFGALTAFDGITVAFRPGEITSVVGPNGTGKSTLLKCIVGLVRPNSGEITIDGTIVGRDWRYRERVGYVPQSPRFPEALSANELLNFLSDLRGVRAVNSHRLIDLFDLKPVMSRPLRHLSGGTRQKISILVGTVFDPEILVMDEPMVGLDPLAARRQKQWLLEQRSNGRTIIMASHVMAEVEAFADRVTFLLDGRVYFDGAPAAALVSSGERTLENAIAKMMETGSACARC